MPWSARDASRHTKRAKTPAQKRKWAKVANAALREYGDEGRAVRAANAALIPKKKKKAKKRKR